MTSGSLMYYGLAAIFWKSFGQVLIAPHHPSWVVQGRSILWATKNDSVATQFGDNGVSEDPALATFFPNIGICWIFACSFDDSGRAVLTPFTFSICDPLGIKAT